MHERSIHSFYDQEQLKPLAPMYCRLILSTALSICLISVSCSPGPGRYSAAQTRAAATPSEDNHASGQTAVVKSVRAYLRDKPSKAGGPVTTLEKGKRLVVIEKARVGPWYQVREKETGASGWIHGNTITLVQDTPQVRRSQEQVITTQAEQPCSPSG